jgi:hypothetical protein
MKDSIVDSQMWIRLDLDIAVKANIMYQVNSIHRSHFLTTLLLYEKIYIPTKDFGIVPVLITWLGLNNFLSLIKSDSLGFLYLPSIIGYGGGGKGLSLIEIFDKKETPFAWHQAATFSTSDISIELQIANQCPFISKVERSKLCRLILESTINLELNEEFFQKNIVEETYNDIIHSDYLCSLLSIENHSNSKEQFINNLPNINNNQYKILGMNPVSDSIDYVLRIAEINLELIFGQTTANSDIGTSLGAERLLLNKLKRRNVNQAVINGFFRLMELNNLPDIDQTLISGIFSIKDYIKIRNSRNAQLFRKWLRKCNVDDSRELEKMYVDILRKISNINNLPIKLLRFFTTNSIGLLEPFSGMTIAAIDSLLIEKLLSGYNPSLFINDLSKIIVEKEVK